MQSILTVQIPAGSQDLVALDDLKADLDITDTTNDAVLARRITEASLAIAAYCRRTFKGKSELLSETVIEEFRHKRVGFALHQDWPERIMLRRWPVTDIQSIVETDFDGSSITLDPNTDFELDGESAMLMRLETALPRRWRFAKLTVTYTAGLSPYDIPANLQQACLALARLGWFERKRDPMLTRQDVSGVISQSFWVGVFKGSDGMPITVATLLSPYIAADHAL